MTRPLRLLAVLPLLVVAGCGGDEPAREADATPSLEPGAEAYVDAIAGSLAEPEGSPVDEEEARCFSAGFVSVVGVERLEEAGTPEEVSAQAEDLVFGKVEVTRDEGEEIYGWFEKCGVDLRETMLSSFVDDESVAQDARDCVEETLTEERVEDFFVTLLVDGENALETNPALEELTSDLMACMTGGLMEEPPAGE